MNRRHLSCMALLSACFALAGCGAGGSLTQTITNPGPIYTPPVGNYAGQSFTGKVMAGSLPVIGASVQVYAAGTTGNGSGGTQLFTNAVTTDSNGAFTIGTAYTCPYNISVLYIVASGGKAGANGATNAGTMLATSPGSCDSFTSGATFTLNEVTTVATAYAFRQFMAAGGALGSSSGNASSNTSGISLAAGTFANLVNVNKGTMPGAAFPTATAAAPVAKINALANLLNSCIASTGASSTACANAYSAAAGTGTAPNNTLDAALKLVSNPGTNVDKIYAASTASTAYAPVPATQPADWTLYVNYTGGGMNDPSAVSIDSKGRVWVANYFSVASLFSNTGVPAFSGGIAGNNLRESYGGAVDANDVMWIANEESSYGINYGLGSITLLNSAGTSPATYGSGGLNFPISVAMDTSNTAWVVDYGNSHLTLLSNGGTPQSGTDGYTTSQFVFPVAVSVDNNRNGYIANQSSNTITKVSADGKSIQSFQVADGASGVAVDSANNVWVTGYYGSAVGLVSASGQVLSGAGYKGGGVKYPQGVAVDGANNVWVTNYRGTAISQLAGAGTTTPGAAISPSTGWAPDANLLEAFGIAIDGAGNLWVSSFGSNTLTEYVGMAVPVKTPLIGAVRVP